MLIVERDDNLSRNIKIQNCSKTQNNWDWCNSVITAPQDNFSSWLETKLELYRNIVKETKVMTIDSFY